MSTWPPRHTLISRECWPRQSRHVNRHRTDHRPGRCRQEWRPVVSQATCTPVLSQQLVGRAGRMIGGDALSSPCPSSWLAWLVALPADDWLASLDGACPQRSDHLVGGGFGHLDQREPVGDLNRADVAATEPRLASNGPDQILGSHPGGASGPNEQARAPIGWRAAPSPVASSDRTPPVWLAVWPHCSLWDLVRVSGGSGGLVGPLDRGQRHLQHIELLGEWLHRAPEPLQVVLQQAFPQRRPGQLQPPGAQVGDGGQLLDSDWLVGCPLDGLEHPVFSWLGEGD